MPRGPRRVWRWLSAFLHDFAPLLPHPRSPSALTHAHVDDISNRRDVALAGLPRRLLLPQQPPRCHHLLHDLAGGQAALQAHAACGAGACVLEVVVVG